MVALTKKLQKGPLAEGSVIVYTMLQKQADEVAEHLLRNNVEAVSYHAGKHDAEVKFRRNFTWLSHVTEEESSENVHDEQGEGRGGHSCLWYGIRQARCQICHPLLSTQEHRELHPRDR